MSDFEPRTDIDTIEPTVERLRRAFRNGRTRPLAWRQEQLRALEQLLGNHEPEIAEALALDLGKSEIESYATDVGFVLGDIAYTRKHLSSWAKPQRARTPLVLQPARAEIAPEPLGVTLVIAPWNYPFHLALVPAIAAIAAGNAVVIKPSELAPASSEAMARLVPRYLDTNAVAVVEGGAAETSALLKQRFDHIFYTGGARVAHIVMEAAAKNLTPVTLELGGKSPAIVDRNARIDVAARRIVLGKFLNAGQTCVAPDYVLVHESVEAELLGELAGAVESFYGPNPKASPDVARIVNEAHFRRLEKLLDSGEVVLGGETDENERYIAPTVLRGVTADDPVMSEEIFGPILPVLAVASIAEAIEFVNDRDNPLALYVFSEDGDTTQRVIDETSSGGAAVNTTIMHLTVPELPFGGVGASGMGAYHGKAGFDTFSHQRGILTKPTRPDSAITYPPFTKLKQRIIRRFM